MHSRVVAVDAAAARLGGGVSRVRELVGASAVLAPEHRYLFAVSRRVASLVQELPPAGDFLLVPRIAGTVAGRLLWEHVALAARFKRERADWVLAPFNVLPLGTLRSSGVRRAVIVSNIAPFEPSLRAEARGYGAARLRMLDTLTRRSLRSADVAFFLSRRGVELLGEEVRRGEVIRLPMSPPNPAVLEAPEVGGGVAPAKNDRRPFFLVVSDLMRHKGVEDAVEAGRLLEQQGVAARVVICGGDVEAEYARELRARTARSARRVEFVGPRAQVEVLSMMRTCVAVLICSRVENTSRVPVEAMATGAPVIAADVPVARDSCGNAAAYYPAGDAGALAEIMTNLLHDDEARGTLTRKGKLHLTGLDWLSATRAILQAMELL